MELSELSVFREAMDPFQRGVEFACAALGAEEPSHLAVLRGFVGEPQKYFRDRLHWTLTPQQEFALEEIAKADRLLIPAANAVGKTFILAGYGLYVFEARAALPNRENGMPRQGARLLLPGPDQNTIFATVYSEMLDHANRAEEYGFKMPGIRSQLSVNWHVRPLWHMEAFSPPKKAGQKVRHTAAGRHHPNMVALIEEGQGVDEPTWKGVEGMCVSQGNQIISSFNPTEPEGPAYQRALAGGYKVIHLDAFDHPNVQKRQYVVPAAIDFKRIDERVRLNCQDMGSYPDKEPDEHHEEFTYALPPVGASEKGSRADGVPGHPDGEVRVYRPDWDFTSRVRGQWPQSAVGGLFSPAAWDAGVERWRRRVRLDHIVPQCIGVDAARMGSDDTVATPRWGPDPHVVLMQYKEAQSEGDMDEMIRLRKKCRVILGEARVMIKGDGPTVAREIYKTFSGSPMNVDEGGVGASVLDHLTRMLGVDATGVPFGGGALTPLPGEQLGFNLRACMYIRAAHLCNLGLLDPPENPQLREEVMASHIEIVDKSFTQERRDGTKYVERRPTVKIIAKDKIIKEIGRSPDLADSLVLAVHTPKRAPINKQKGWKSFL